jgi:O-antigen/teichoic acid export membrane protein
VRWRGEDRQERRAKGRDDRDPAGDGAAGGARRGQAAAADEGWRGVTPAGVDPNRAASLLSRVVLRLSRLAVTYGAGRLSTKALGVLLVPIYTRFLSPADLGVVATAALVASILGLVGKLHQDASLLRFYYEFRDSREALGRFLGGLMGLVTVAPALLASVLILAGGPVAERLLPELPFRPHLRYVLLTAAFSPLPAAALMLYRVREQAGRYAAAQVGSFLLTTAFILYFVVLREEGALGQIKGALLGTFGAFLVFAILVAREVRLPPSAAHLRASLAYGVPLVPQGLADWVIQGADRFFLARYRTMAAVGLYSLGYTIAGVANLFVLSIHQAFAPFFFSVAEDREQATSLVPRLFTYFLLTVSVGVLLIGLHGEAIIWLLGNPGYAGAAGVIPILASVYLFSPFIFVGSSQILYRKRSPLLVWIILAAGVLNLILNIVLIPAWGMMGAGLATWVTYGGYAGLTWWWAQGLYRVPFEYGRIARLFLFTLAALGLATVQGEPAGVGGFLLRESLLPGFFVGLAISGFFDGRDQALVARLVEQLRSPGSARPRAEGSGVNR